MSSLLGTSQAGLSTIQVQINQVNCIICLSEIERTEPVWHCVYCYEISHLSCAMRWYIEEERLRTTCLCCRATLVNVPDKIPCFCGRATEGRMIFPNGCGLVCGKMLGDCLHLCQSLCHPGKCAPCCAQMM